MYKTQFSPTIKLGFGLISLLFLFTVKPISQSKDSQLYVTKANPILHEEKTGCSSPQKGLHSASCLFTQTSLN